VTARTGAAHGMQTHGWRATDVAEELDVPLQVHRVIGQIKALDPNDLHGARRPWAEVQRGMRDRPHATSALPPRRRRRPREHLQRRPPLQPDGERLAATANGVHLVLVERQRRQRQQPRHVAGLRLVAAVDSTALDAADTSELPVGGARNRLRYGCARATTDASGTTGCSGPMSR